jgi:hypothetical protein
MIGSPRSDENRGKVYSFTVGANVSVGRDLGPGWKHVAVVRNGGTLHFYTDGKMAASAACEADKVDLSNEAPLKIGLGSHSHFRGKIREVRLYNRALGDAEIQAIASRPRSETDTNR